MEKIKPKKNIKRFTKKEDEVIDAFIQEHLEEQGINFCLTWLFFIFNGIHSLRAIRDRWNNFISKDNADFTEEEDKLIQSLYESLGNKWSQIAKYFGNRSSTQIRIRFYHLQRKEKKMKKNDQYYCSMFAFLDDINLFE